MKTKWILLAIVTLLLVAIIPISKVRANSLSTTSQTTTSQAWEWIDGELVLVNTIQQVDVETATQLGQPEDIIFTKTRSLQWYVGMLNRLYVRAKGTSSTNVTANELYVFVWWYYGPQGNNNNCVYGVLTDDDTTNNSTSANANTGYIQSPHGKLHCIKNAQHHGMVNNVWMFWYDGVMGPYTNIP